MTKDMKSVGGMEVRKFDVHIHAQEGIGVGVRGRG